MLKRGVRLVGPDGPSQRVDDYWRRLKARRNVRVLHMTSTPPTIADLQSRYCGRAVQDQPLLQGFAHPPDGLFHFCPMMARAPGALTGFPMRSQPSLQTGPLAEACDKRLSVGLDEGRGCAAAKPRKIGNPFSWERFRPKKSLGSRSEDTRRIRLPGAKQRDLHDRQAISFWPPTRGPGRALADYDAV